MNRSQILQHTADEERQRCTDWLLPIIDTSQPKYVSKVELRSIAIKELGIKKYSFNFASINAIETAGRHDWYEPLRTRRTTKM